MNRLLSIVAPSRVTTKLPDAPPAEPMEIDIENQEPKRPPTAPEVPTVSMFKHMKHEYTHLLYFTMVVQTVAVALSAAIFANTLMEK